METELPFDWVLHQSADFWVAVWTFLLVVATGALARIAYIQIKEARLENRKTQTLVACGQYDTNPVMYDAQKALHDARISSKLDRDPRPLRLPIMTVLNFLDAIAIGIRQGLYVDVLAKEHLRHILKKHVKDLIFNGTLEKLDCPRESFSDLIRLNDRWQKEDQDARPEILSPPFAPLKEGFCHLLRRAGLR